MTSKQEQQNEVNIARIDERLNGLAQTVDEIKGNHLVHIANDIKDLQQGQIETNLKIAKWSGGVGVIVILAQILIRILWK